MPGLTINACRDRKESRTGLVSCILQPPCLRHQHQHQHISSIMSLSLHLSQPRVDLQLRPLNDMLPLPFGGLPPPRLTPLTPYPLPPSFPPPSPTAGSREPERWVEDVQGNWGGGGTTPGPERSFSNRAPGQRFSDLPDSAIGRTIACGACAAQSPHKSIAAPLRVWRGSRTRLRRSGPDDMASCHSLSLGLLITSVELCASKK